METITFHCKVITPMFLAGADGQTPELRAPSIKGAMRFWWRALNGHLVEKKDGKWDYSKLKEKEGAIFGGTTRKSSFDILISSNDLPYSKEKLSGRKVILKKWDNKRGKEMQIPIDLLEYLCYGVLDPVPGQGNVFNRPYIVPHQEFEVNLIFRGCTYKEEVIKSFAALIYFGGIGSKSRNGFGCLAITNEIELKFDFADLIKGELKPYTAFSSQSEVRVTKTYEKHQWKDALSDLGEIYKNAREKMEPKHVYDKRIYLGSPLIADKKTFSFLERHSKSLFMSLNINSGGKLYGQILFTPYLYMEDHPDLTKAHQENYEAHYNEFYNFLRTKTTKVS